MSSVFDARPICEVRHDVVVFLEVALQGDAE